MKYLPIFIIIAATATSVSVYSEMNNLDKGTLNKNIFISIRDISLLDKINKDYIGFGSSSSSFGGGSGGYGGGSGGYCGGSGGYCGGSGGYGGGSGGYGSGSGSPSAPSGSPSAPSGSPSAPSGSPSAPSGSPSAPSGLPSVPSGLPSVPQSPDVSFPEISTSPSVVRLSPIFNGRIETLITKTNSGIIDQKPFVDPEKFCVYCNETEGPGLGGAVIPIFGLESPDLIQNGGSSSTGDNESLMAENHVRSVLELYKSKKLQLGNQILIIESKADKFSDDIKGNGVLVKDNAILTARHVAESISENPSLFKILLIGPLDKRVYNVVEYSHVKYLNELNNPDLAIIFIKENTLPFEIPIPKKCVIPQNIKTTIFSFGAAEYGDLPRVATGIVTTKVKDIDLSKGLKSLLLTSFGTNLRSFPSLSGSPVFSIDSGELIGIIASGSKFYVETGSRVHHVTDETKWDSFEDWTWVVPLWQYWDEIESIIS